MMLLSSHTLTVLCCILHTLALLSSSSAAEDFERILRGNQRDCLRQENGPEASLVQSKAFQKDFFDDTFPPVTFIKDFEYECDITRKDAMAFGRRMLEMQQAVSFTHFFREIYPKTTFKRASELSRTDSLVFWPICGYAQGYMGNVSEAERDQKGIERGIQILRDPKMKKLLMNATDIVHESRHFWVAEHPMITPATAGRMLANPFSRIRMLAVDVGGGGNFYSIMIPQGVAPELCVPDVPSEAERPNLVSFCGHPKAGGGFPSLRPHIADLLQGIIEGDGEKNIHASLAQPREEYTKLFFQSKFCFVTPGDTSSTSQGVRSMCGGCVPIWMYPDVRELPFVQILWYPSFSLLYKPVQLGTPEDMRRLVDRLKVLISSGEYDEMVENLQLARKFFDYEAMLPASPYGAALASIMSDEADHKCLVHGKPGW